jgi:hypothetical protein
MHSNEFLKYFAICLDNRDYPVSLEMHKVYQVIADKDAQADGDLRVIDESGEDYLYPADHFLLLPLPDQFLVHLEKSFSLMAAGKEMRQAVE